MDSNFLAANGGIKLTQKKLTGIWSKAVLKTTKESTSILNFKNWTRKIGGALFFKIIPSTVYKK